MDFQRRHHQLLNLTSRSLVINYLENQIITDQVEEERLFHLLQFLSFVKSYQSSSSTLRKKIKSYLLESLMELSKTKSIQNDLILEFKNGQTIIVREMKIQHFTNLERIKLQENIKF